MELAGGAAIVTGAGGGIGGALAHRLAAEGLALVLSDLDADRLAATVASLPERTDVTAVVGDVSDPAHHAELVTVAEDHGGLVLSVLNAAVYLPGQSWDMPIEQWQLQVDVNFWGVLHGVRAAVPAMAARGTGTVVAVSSGAGLVAMPMLAPYVATKHAVVGLMESLQHELARTNPGVRAAVVCPGNIATPLAMNSLDAANVVNEQLPDAAAGVVAGLRAGVAAGAEPMTVADAVVDAVREDRFWVLPQPEVAYGALDRVQRIVDGRPPVDLAG